MTVSAKGLRFTEAHEGLVTRAYRCPAGVLTIGIGHTSAAGAPKVTDGMTITKAEAREIFKRDIIRYNERARKRLPNATQNMEDMATDFDYNTGRVHNAKWAGKVLEGDMETAERLLRTTFVTGGGKVLKGLVRRRNENADVAFDNKWPATIPTDLHVSKTPEEVKQYQTALKTLGYYEGEIDGIGPEGSKTDKAVRRFQGDKKLVVDGKVGPATRAALTRALDARRDKQTAGGVGAATGTGTAGVDATTPDPTPAVPDPTTVMPDINWWLVIMLALAAVAAVYIGLRLYRNRGRITGKRVRT